MPENFKSTRVVEVTLRVAIDDEHFIQDPVLGTVASFGDFVEACVRMGLASRREDENHKAGRPATPDRPSHTGVDIVLWGTRRV